MDSQPTFIANLPLEGVEDLVTPRFAHTAMERGYVATQGDSWGTEVESLPTVEGSVLIAATKGRYHEFALLTLDDTLVYIRLYTPQKRATVYVAAKDLATAETVFTKVKALLPEFDKEDEPDTVPVRFWTRGAMGSPQQVTRRIAAPVLADIADNYSAAARADLEATFDPGFKPGAGGQLLLWYGPPGTGKTYALRALAQAWRKWCRIDYVVDPEAFFGDSAYLMPVLLGHDPADEDQPWRLLIFEDTGELLSADARARAGQGLSRLLNVVDGFIGQGMNTLVLITTNEDLDRLHPAVSRPGRCAVKTEFGRLSPAASAQWAKRHGFEVPMREHSLAELFALRDETRTDAKAESAPFGFRAPAA